MNNFYQNQKVRVTITACDPAQRKVHARFKDGGSTSIAVFEVGAAFRWPQVGEVWTVSRQNNFWILGSRVNHDPAEAFPATGLANDQLRLDGQTIFDTTGRQMVSIVQSGVQDQDTIKWDAPSTSWVPGSLSLTPTNTIQFVPINISAAGVHELVAAGATVAIKVVSYVMVASGVTNMVFQSGTTNLTGIIPLVANGGISAISDIASPLFQTAVNAALNIDCSAAGLTGHLSYIQA